MKNFSYIFAVVFSLLGSLHSAFAQETIPDRTREGNGGEYKVDRADCVSDALRAAVLAKSDANLKRLISSGRYKPKATAEVASFDWPLRPRAGFTDPGYYGISNYVDENPAKNAVLESNCGQRTYDGHLGTDISIWPFPWTKMANNDVEVVAAAAGVITYKADGNFDQNCTLNNNRSDANAIIIRHSDGSQGLYWHFKSGSVTTKAVGANVAKGEFLGRVGSSGYSDGPHLHFEVKTSDGSPIDPWGGPCNNLGGQSWWQSQLPYRDPRIVKVMTHNAEPLMPRCPPETVNAANYFGPGQKIYFGSYFCDRMAGDIATYTVKQPDGTVWETWTQTPDATSNFYWWYWWFTLPNNAATGTWTFQVVCNGQTATHLFGVGTGTAPTPLSPANVNTTNLEADIVAEVNRMRANPKAYADELAKLVFVPVGSGRSVGLFAANDLMWSCYKDVPDYVTCMNDYRSKLQEAIDALYGLSTAQYPVIGPLPQLVRRTELNKACEMLAADMGQIDGAQHRDSKGRGAFCRAGLSGYTKRIGECLNSNFTSARGFVLSLMTSTAHRKILTDAGYEEIGVDTHYHPKAGDYDDYIRNVIMLGDKDALAPADPCKNGL